MSNELPEIWLARHGETEWTISRRHTGTTDVPLTAGGREQAELFGEHYVGVEFDLVLSSPMSRALETARLADLEPKVDARLTEWDYGEYEGLTTAEIKEQRPEWDLWRDGCPGGESAAAVGARLQPLLDELRAHGGGRVALFGHGHCLRALAGCWLGLGPEGGRVLLLGTASLSIMATEHGGPVIASWNLVHP